MDKGQTEIKVTTQPIIENRNTAGTAFSRVEKEFKTISKETRRRLTEAAEILKEKGVKGGGREALKVLAGKRKDEGIRQNDESRSQLQSQSQLDRDETIPGIAPSEKGIMPKAQSAEAPTVSAGTSAEKAESASNVEQIKKELKEELDPRTISKKVDAEGRTETARAILEARASRKATSESIASREKKLQEIEELITSSYQQERKIEEELTQRLESLLVKLKRAVGIGDEQAAILQREIDTVKSERDALYAQLFAVEEELKTLRKKLEEIPDPKQLIEAYYEKIATTPLSNEQKRRLLKPEVLASLTTEEYIALWRRLNPYFLAHVTRQGFRDHNAMIYHSAGLEQFHNGFLNIMQDDRLLRPPIALAGLKNRDKASVKNWLHDWVLQAEDEKQARERLKNLLHFHLARAPKYPDETAVHFAAQIVADGYYGGESGNEVFFIYPSDVLASQYAFAFNGWEKDFTRPQSETKWNDVFVWPQSTENPGIPIDAGIVFLPETTPVDPQTGSKYASEVRVIDGQEKRVMIEDTVAISTFVEWGKKLDESSPLRKLFTAYKEERNYYKQQILQKECFTAFVRELEGLGFKPDASSALASILIGEMHIRDTFDQEILEGIIRRAGAHWKRAENPVPAKEYWESFFAKNPHLRPKHVVYYDGDPTTAVYKFLQQNNIGRADTSKTEGKLLGFDDNHVLDMENDPRANKGYDELVAIANKIIEEYYRKQ
jgi:hypothetical protein